MASICRGIFDDIWLDRYTWHIVLVSSMSLMASRIRSVGGLSKYFYQGLWLADLNADVICQSINTHGVA